MKAASLCSVCILSCIFMLLCAITVNGCPSDSDTSHTSADYNQRLYSYSSNQPVSPSKKNELKFMTFNQRSGFLYNCVSDVRAQALTMRPMDYVGTQETVQNVDTRCNCNIPQTIADVAGFSTRFVMALPWRTGQYGLSAGTSQQILDTQFMTVEYSGYETRVAVALKTKPDALQGRFLWFVNVHIEYYSLTVRQFQIAKILPWIQSTIIDKDPQAVIVISGDFNGGPWDPVYQTMKSNNYVNTWEEFHGSIFDGNTIPADWPGSRFDHIWYRVPTGTIVTIPDAEVLDVRQSDHRPYRATLSFSFPQASTTAPTVAPTTVPSRAPTTAPTLAPTTAPTASPTESVVCVGPIFENVDVTIKCPLASQKMTSLQFASYGTPTGTCGNYKLGTCIGGSSNAVVLDKCMNRASCTFPIANNVFGDPCPGTGKHFFVQVLCK